MTSASARQPCVARGEHDAADPRIERQLRELAAQRRQRRARIDGVELLQQLVAVGDRPRRRRIEERKRGDVAERKRRHLQDHRRKRAAQDLRIGVRRARRVIVVAVQSHADAVRNAAAAPGALVGRRLRDLLDLQQRRLVAHRVALDARKSAVDHVPNARHRQRRLGDVRREHDPSAPRRRENALLLFHGEPRVERQQLELHSRRDAARASAAARRRSRGSHARRAGTRACRPGAARHKSSTAPAMASSSSSSSSASASPEPSGR